jgi:hypothetical protein
VTEDAEAPPDDLPPWDAGESPFAWECRVMAVAGVWTLPGFLAGILARLCVTDGGPVNYWVITGVVFGAIASGTLEADHWP